MEITCKPDPTAIIERLTKENQKSERRPQGENNTYQYPKSKARPTSIPGAYCIKSWKLPIQLKRKLKNLRNFERRRYLMFDGLSVFKNDLV